MIKKIFKLIEESGEMKEMLWSVYQYLLNFSKKNDMKRIYKIIEAMKIVDRKCFMIEGLEEVAYVDSAFPTFLGQTISQPSTVGRMLMLAKLKKGLDVLEVGGGSGWSASLSCYIVYPGKVISLEKYKELVEFAEGNVKKLKMKLEEKYGKENKIIKKFDNLKFINKNIFDFNEGKYDRIIFTAGILNFDKKIEKILLKLLKDNGIAILPHTAGPLLIVQKKKEKLKKQKTKEEYVFVPLLQEEDKLF